MFSNAYRLSFLIDGDDEENSFVVGKSAWLLRSIFGFVVNLVLRDFVGYSVPILLMNFHNPIDCVIYSVARSYRTAFPAISAPCGADSRVLY